MLPPLTTLRQNAPRITARRFLSFNPGAHIQYFDDTPAKDPRKALAANAFDPVAARRKQRDRCAVCFSLQAFGDRRTKDDLLCFRNLGVDVDLVAPPARATLPAGAIDRRKEEYLRQVLGPFPLAAHWLIETRHGFHVVFRLQPQREPNAVAEAEALNRRLVAALRGDPNAALLTQLLRVPGTLHFKIPDQPFLCRLLLDHATEIPPYPFATVSTVLDRWEASHRSPRDRAPGAASSTDRPRWRDGLGGVPEGQRNVTAASLIGMILGRLPEDLWETAGWGGLKEWNRRNAIPLPESELRSVFESIARRERARRPASGRMALVPARPQSLPASPAGTDLSEVMGGAADGIGPTHDTPPSPSPPC